MAYLFRIQEESKQRDIYIIIKQTFGNDNESKNKADKTKKQYNWSIVKHEVHLSQKL